MKNKNKIIFLGMFLVVIGILSYHNKMRTFALPSSSPDWCEIGVPYRAVDGLTVTLNSFTIVEKIGSYQYGISYTLENENLDGKILEGSFKMYYRDSAGGLPQYGFFDYLFPGDTTTRGYTFEEIKSMPFDVLEYHHDNFFSSEPLIDSLKWRVEIPDDTPPSTVDDYNGLWHSADSAITLTATDYESGIAETYYKINDGPIKAVSTDGQPYVTIEGTNNTLEYWSINNADIEENHHVLTDIKIDKTNPVTVDDYDGLWHIEDFTINLTSNDELSGVAETYYRINDGGTKNVSVNGQPHFQVVQAEDAIVVDGDISDWIALGLSSIGTDPPDNIEGYYAISSDLLEAWACTGPEKLYVAMKVNGQGAYDFDRIGYQVYLSTNVELFKVKYYYWYDEEGYGYLFYWDEGSEIWQARIPSLEAQAGSGGYIEWEIPYFDSYGRAVFDYDSPVVTLRFVTLDEYYGGEINDIQGTISLPTSFPDSITESPNNKLEYWSVDNVGNEEVPHKVLTVIKIDNTPPAGSITINNNDAYTDSHSVIAMLSATDAASDVSGMRLSNDNATWSSWEAYSNSKSWDLSLGDGTKTVYVQFKDNAGLASNVYTDSIIVDTIPPEIIVVSPENMTYITTSIHLEFAVEEDTSWMAYSLDEKSNVTVSGNTTLAALSEGRHSLLVWANDTAGNMGASEMIYFSVETQKTEPLPTLVAAAIVIITVVGAVVVVYFTKFKK